MGFWFDQLGTIVLNASLSGAALLAMLSLGVVICPQPARRLRIVRGTLIGLLVLFPLECSAILPRFELWTISERTMLPGLASDSGWQNAGLLASGSGYTRIERPMGSWTRILLVVYGVGVAGALSWLGLGYFLQGRLGRLAIEPSPETLALYHSLSRTHSRPLPGLLVVTSVRSPVLVGLFRPLILLPAEYDDPEPTPEQTERLRVSLLHELAHHEAGDPWFLLVARLAHALWFFLPSLGWVLERMRLDQELMADRRAAIGFGPVGDYAASLLDLASLSADQVSGKEQQALLNEVIAEVGSARLPDDPLGSPLFQRLRMLLRAPFPVEPNPPSWWSWGMPGLTTVVTLCAASVAVLPASAARGPDWSVQETDRLFRLARVEVAAARAQPNGRAPRIELPIPLPSRFDLTVEVLATRHELDRTRIAGQALGTPRPLQSPASDAAASWHHVRLNHVHGRARLWINGRDTPLPADHDPFPVWLSLEPPPDQDGRYRNLHLAW